MKKKSIKKTFNKRVGFAFLLGISASFSPLLVMGSCDNGNQDALSKEIRKLTYTALNDEDFKKAMISDAVLDEDVAEQLGFVLPDILKKYIEKVKDTAAPYIIKVSKAKDSLEVTYKYQKAGEEKEKTQKVTVTPYQSDDLSTILEKLKNYNASDISEKNWKNISASGFDVLINSDDKAKSLQIRKITDYAKALKDNKNIEVYIRKEKNKDTIKYLVVKTLEHGKKIVAMGNPVMVSPTPEALIAIRDELDYGLKGDNILETSASTHQLKNFEFAKTVIISEDANNEFNWDDIKVKSPDIEHLIHPDELQDPAATTKGKIEIEKHKGETILHWYITYIDKNNKPLTYEYISEIITGPPTLEEAKQYDWENAAVLKYGDVPLNLPFATKEMVSRIEKRDENNTPTYIYIYTRNNKQIVQYRLYTGVRIDIMEYKAFWVASNAEEKYFNNIRVLYTSNTTPKFEDFIDDKKDNFIPIEIRYMEIP